jgi:hypothetical protein
MVAETVTACLEKPSTQNFPQTENLQFEDIFKKYATTCIKIYPSKMTVLFVARCLINSAD